MLTANVKLCNTTYIMIPFDIKNGNVSRTFKRNIISSKYINTKKYE